MNLTELELAQRIRDGTAPSPMKFSNMWLVNIRITGTGLAYRTGLKEHVWRDPNLYLNDEFLQRCNGLPVIANHPDGADGFVWDLTNNVVDIYSSSSSGNPKVDIKLLMVSAQNNLTIAKDSDGNVTWDTSKPCGLFLI